ncbi:MAG: hypothetical protein K6F45_05565 [Saccharofermentans sp.]|nr:hypothetical protein [Saccharofermentans sp.]
MMRRGFRIIKRLQALALAAVMTAGVIVCSGSTLAMADIGQPDITVPPLTDVHCASYCVYDKTTDMIVISQNLDDKIYPASQTKIMTCMLSLEILDLNAQLTTSETAMSYVEEGSSVMGIKVGEKVKVSELLYGLMLPSGNDAAYVLAEGCIDAFFEKYPEGGDTVNEDGVNAQYLIDTLGDTKENILANRKIEAFAALMNLRAATLGCTGTHFTNPCGLHDEDHYTTAHDLCIMMCAATNNQDFNILISSQTHVFEATSLHKADAWDYVKNTNNLLFDPWLASKTANGTPSHLAAIVGGKTGTTDAAGKGCTLYTVCENGHELMVSMCGVPKEYYFYTTMYLASITAYGNLACWENDPVAVIPGTTGDYKWINAPEDQQPVLNVIHFPGDAPYMPAIDTTPSVTGEVTPGVAPDGTPVPVSESPIVLFVKANKEVSLVIGVIMLSIIIINIVLVVRIHRLKNAGKRRAKKHSGTGSELF